jgi:hypothetical protein
MPAIYISDTNTLLPVLLLLVHRAGFIFAISPHQLELATAISYRPIAVAPEGASVNQCRLNAESGLHRGSLSDLPAASTETITRASPEKQAE